MTKPEYGDFYKFIASVGIVLLSLAILLPWLFLRETFDVQIKAEDIAKLPMTAQDIIVYRQNTTLWWIQNVGWFSFFLGMFGFATLFIGIYFWRRKQLMLDEKESLEVQKLKREITPLTKEELVENTIKDVGKQVEAEKVDPDSSNSLMPDLLIDTVNRTFATERLVAEKLRQCFNGEYEILSNQKVGDAEYDIIAVPLSHLERHIIIDVRFSTKVFGLGFVREILTGLVQAINVYRRKVAKEVVGVALFISPKSALDVKGGKQTQRYMIEDFASNLGVYFHVLAFEELEKIQCDELQRMILPNNEQLNMRVT